MSADDLPQPEIVDLQPASTAVVRGVVPMAELPAFFDRSFPQLGGAVGAQGATVTGAAFARYHGVPTDVVDIELGFPTAAPIQPDGDVQAGTLPGGRVARLEHRGAYDELASSWARLQAWITEAGETPTGEIWEVYVTEPTPDVDPADLRTELHWLLA